MCIRDSVVIGAVMEHIESAGIHSGDSACVLPPYLMPPEAVDQMRAHTVAFAKALGVVGLINVQYAYKDGVVYVIEVNPRASRTAPFVSKAIGVPPPSVAPPPAPGATRRRGLVRLVGEVARASQDFAGFGLSRRDLTVSPLKEMDQFSGEARL